MLCDDRGLEYKTVPIDGVWFTMCSRKQSVYRSNDQYSSLFRNTDNNSTMLLLPDAIIHGVRSLDDPKHHHEIRINVHMHSVRVFSFWKGDTCE